MTVQSLPAGVTTINQPIVLGPGSALLGFGSAVCTLETTGDFPAVILAGSGIRAEGFGIRRQAPMAGSVAAVESTHPGMNILLKDIIVDGYYMGFDLLGTAYGIIQDCTAQGCEVHGFRFRNDDTCVPMQWNLVNVLSLQNGGWGFKMMAIADAYATSGLWTNVTTFANSMGGYLFEAIAGRSLNDVRIVGINASGEGGHGVCFNTDGEHNQILGGLIEGSGTGNTGPGMGTPPSHVGGGVVLSGSNITVALAGLSIRVNSHDGIGVGGQGSCQHLTVTGCLVSANNQARVGLGGVTIGDPDCVATLAACQSWGAPQHHGIWAASPGNLHTSACVFLP